MANILNWIIFWVWIKFCDSIKDYAKMVGVSEGKNEKTVLCFMVAWIRVMVMVFGLHFNLSLDSMGSLYSLDSLAKNRRRNSNPNTYSNFFVTVVQSR